MTNEIITNTQRARHLILMAIDTQREPTEAHLFAEAAQRNIPDWILETTIGTLLDEGLIKSTLIIERNGPRDAYRDRHHPALTRA